MNVCREFDPNGNVMYVPDQPQIDINSVLGHWYRYQELEIKCANKFGCTLEQLVATMQRQETRETEEYDIG